MSNLNTETITTTADVVQTAVFNLLDTSEQKLATSVADEPSSTAELNEASAHNEPKVDTLRRETDPASEPVCFYVRAVLYCAVDMLFDSDDEAIAFDNELRKAFAVDLPGCKNFEFQGSLSDKWAILLPIRFSFSMPKGVADLLCDEDIEDRVEAELRRLAAKIPIPSTYETKGPYLLHDVFMVRVANIWRDPEMDEDLAE